MLKCCRYHDVIGYHLGRYIGVFAQICIALGLAGTGIAQASCKSHKVVLCSQSVKVCLLPVGLVSYCLVALSIGCISNSASGIIQLLATSHQGDTIFKLYWSVGHCMRW